MKVEVKENEGKSVCEVKGKGKSKERHMREAKGKISEQKREKEE